MAVYKSSHKGSQVDNTVSATLANKGKGSDELPVYLDGNMLAQNITVDDTPIQGSPNPVTSEGILSDAELNIDYSDIQTSMTGDGTKPVSQKAIRDYTINTVNTKQARIEDSDTIEVADNGAVNVTANVLKNNDGRLPFKRRYLAKYEIEENAGVKERILNAKRSTFDKSKFTVVGSLTITDDGVASGYSNGNYVQVAQNTFTSPFKICLEWTTGDTISNSNYNWHSDALLSLNGGNSGFVVGQRKGRLQLSNTRTNVADGTVIIADGLYGRENVFTTNTKYFIVMEFTGSRYNFFVNDELIYTFESELYPAMTNKTITIGSYGSNNSVTNGSIDLKQFSNTVDGVEVFSGNKTGIDVIKPDNYTVVGSPVISDDGVASGFTTSNYLTKSNVVTIGSSGEFHIDFEFDYVSHTDNQYILDLYNTISDEIILRREGNSYRAINFVNGTAVFNDNIGVQAGALHVKGFFEYKNGTYTLDINGTQKALSSSTKMNALTYNLSLGARCANTQGQQPLVNGSIDLNSFKIYVDGDLVYQPCLKIPYTKAKDGNKIVDSEYRDRVKEQYDEEGYTAYYTVGAERDYAVVGNPIISEDGVASGFSSTTYLTKTLTSIPLTSEIRIIGKGTYQQDNNNILWSTNALSLRCQVYPHRIQFFGSFTGQTNVTINDVSFQNNDEILIDFTLKSGAISIKVYQNGSLIKNVNHPSTFDTTVNLTSVAIGVFSSQYWRGSIDLNAFKIYVDGNLVYQPFIKDAYTLPTKKLSDITYSYEDGPTRCIQKADMSLIQQGICEEGATINFVKPFADTNYYLSCQYTSKTPTGFVAAETGDYIAEGGAASATNKDVNLEVYEFIIDQNIADPKNSVIYTGANAGYNPSYMDYTNDVFNYGSWKDAFFIKAFKPCMLNYDGTVAYYLDPNDYTKKLDGTSSDIANSAFAGNGMVEIGEIWISEKVENGKFRVRIANTKISEDFDCFTHTKKSDGSIVPYTYRSLYDGSLVDGKVRSISGLPVYNKTNGNTMVTNAKANGTGWNIDEYNLRRLVNYLLVLMGKSLNTQAVFGNGVISGGETALVNTGTLNNKGMFYGKNDNVTAVKVFHMENYWGNLWKWYNGLMCLNGKVVCKMCEGTWDGSTVDDYNNTGNGFIETGVNLASAGGSKAYIRRMKLIPKLGLTPMETTGGGSGTSYSDGLWYNTAQAYGFAHLGGSASDGLNCGDFSCNLYDPLSGSYWNMGCALSYRTQ